MREMTVNLLPLGFDHAEAVYQRVLSGMEHLASSTTWQGKHVAFHLQMVDGCMLISGGRRRWEGSRLRFVSMPVDPADLEDGQLAARWNAAFEVLVLVCDAVKLIQSPPLRHQLAKLRLSMLLRNRYQDTIVLLTDADRALQMEPAKRYTEAIWQLNSAFSSQPLGPTVLVPELRQQWEELAPLLVAQDELCYRTRRRHRLFRLPRMLCCQTDSVPNSGYMELLLLLSNRVLEKDQFNIYNLGTKRVYNMGIMNNLKDNLKKFINSDNSIRLAVIGATSSGKTYLLTDFVMALRHLGYQPVNDVDEVSYHRPVSSFINDITNPESGLAKTPIYVCRNYNQYSSVFQNTENKTSIRIDFVDVPGEVVTKESLHEFQAIMQAMLRNKAKFFTVKRWQQEGDNSVVKTIEFQERTAQPVEEDTVNEGLGSLFGNAQLIGTRTKEYMNTDERLQMLQKQLYNEIDSTNISAKDFFKHFTEFDTDTAIQAICDAWEALNIDTFLDEGAAGAAGTGSHRSLFENVYKNHFYFHYYTYYATDVVVCDKCSIPATVAASSADIVYEPMMRALMSLTTFKDVPAKNWYLAFKGIDSIMVADYLKNLFESTHDLNFVYSFFLLLYQRHFVDQSQQFTSGPFGSVKQDGLAFDTDQELRRWLTDNEEVSDGIIEVCGQHLTDIDRQVPYYFRQPADYITGSGKDIRAHIDDRVHLFTELVNDRTDASVISKRFCLPSCVFLTATPIDNHFNIDGHDATDSTKFDGDSRVPERRLCFGTLQLASAVLFKHRMIMDERYNNTGQLLDFVYGEK